MLASALLEIALSPRNWDIQTFLLFAGQYELNIIPVFFFTSNYILFISYIYICINMRVRNL